jgi:hypothetical protein
MKFCQCGPRYNALADRPGSKNNIELWGGPGVFSTRVFVTLTSNGNANIARANIYGAISLNKYDEIKQLKGSRVVR